MYAFSRAVHSMHSEDIRLLMEQSSREGLISFAAGMPNNDLFPVREIDEVYNAMDPELKKLCFQYGPTTGFPPLVKALQKWLSDKGIPVDSGKIMITTGSLQAISVITQEFVDEGDVILTENPSFVGALSVFETYGAKVIGIPIDQHGIDIGLLKKTISELEQPPKFLYVTPNFHNPAGICYSTERRRQLLETLSGTGILLIEDDAYGDLYFDKADIPLIRPMKAYSGYDVDIIYTGSFSKILGPGFRLGYMLSSAQIFEKAEMIKQALDACTSNFMQILACEFMEKGYLHAYLKFLRNEYADRKELLKKSLKKHLPGFVHWNEPKGGFYIWLSLPSHLSASAVFRDCLKHGVVFVTGKTFDPMNLNDRNIRLSFSNMPKRDIEKGVILLAEVIQYHHENSKRSKTSIQIR